MKSTVDHRRRAQRGSASGRTRQVQAQGPATEKCFGVAKAGKNDCQTATSSCAGTFEEGPRSQRLALPSPKGICEKIVGGSLTAAKG